MPDNQLKNIKDHDLYKSIVLTLTQDFNKNPPPPYTAYRKAVHQKMIGIINVLQTLQIARILVAEQHPLVEGTTSRVKPADFLRYNVENYFIRITAYYDVVLQLINDVYRWNIKQDFRFNQSLKSQAKKDKNKDVLKIISSIETILKSVKPKRDKIAHEGTHATDIIFLEIADYLTETIPQQKVDEFDRDLFYGMLILDNVKEMTQIEQDLATNLLRVMDLLYPIYKRAFDSFN